MKRAYRSFSFELGLGRLASGIEPHLRPRTIRRIAAEFDAVVQAERAVVPEFETCGVNAPAAPPLRARHFADHIFGGDLGVRLLEGSATARGPFGTAFTASANQSANSANGCSAAVKSPDVNGAACLMDVVPVMSAVPVAYPRAPERVAVPVRARPI